MQETSTKPYLIRALHEWCIDNGYTPHVVVKVDENTVVPVDYIQDGQIVLNINPLSTNGLLIGNEYLEFQARFNGVVEDIFVPVAAIAAIYSRETNEGMGFEVTDSQPYPSTQTPLAHSDQQPDTTTNTQANINKEKPKGSHLKVIK